MKFITKKFFNQKTVFIDGLTRSGKSIFTNIIPSFKNVEQTEYVFDFEQLLAAYYCKQIKFDYLKAHIHNHFLEKGYNKLLSRSVNFRPGDQTGVANYAFKEISIKRLKKKDGDNNLRDLLNSKNIFLYQTHDMMLHAKPLIQLGLNLKILEIYRNPFDLICDWIKENFISRFTKDIRFWFPIIKFNNGLKGIWYHNIIKKYFKNWNKLNTIEKTSVMAIEITKKCILNQKLLQKKIPIKTFCFEEVIYNDNLVMKLEKFLNTKHSKFTKHFLKKAKIPRNSIENEQAFNKKYLKNNINNKIFRQLEDLEKMYKKNVYGLKK